MFPVSEAIFCVKKTGFRATAAIKQQRRLMIMTNPKMVCSYRYSCLDLPVTLVDFHMKGCEPRLDHVFQGDYVDMNEIDIDISELRICHNYVDKLWMGGKPKKLKKVQHRTVYRTDKSEEDEE